MADTTPSYDFGGARFDLGKPEDREVVRFILSQALYGEATGVYCGKSLYAAGSLEAAKFYVRQARQELNHLQLFADIFRLLEMEPLPAHWVIRALSAHNNYYPLKVLMEHAIGEGMVLDIFKDVLMQTLPEDDERILKIRGKLSAVCKEELEHVEWGEKETKRILTERPWLRTPFYGLLELQLSVLPILIRRFEKMANGHPVLSHMGRFLEHVRSRVWKQGQELGVRSARASGVLQALLGNGVWGRAVHPQPVRAESVAVGEDLSPRARVSGVAGERNYVFGCISVDRARSSRG